MKNSLSQLSSRALTECPSEKQLIGLLEGSLGDGWEEAIERHLDECVRCQDQLNQLATDPLAWPSLLEAIHHSQSTLPLDDDEPGHRGESEQRRGTTEPSSDVPNSKIPLEVPGYELIEEVGRGGAGVIYRARDLRLRRQVAIKVLAGADLEGSVRFRNEAEAMAQLQHPHVVEIFATGTHRDESFLVMEWVTGGDLARHLGGQPMSPREAADLVGKVARAIQAAHRSGILHRDLKPANILLGTPHHPDASIGNQPVSGLYPKVADFGLAAWTEVQHGPTHTGRMIGTPSYMSPEQAAASSGWATPAVDVYALGAILYECMTGRPPFQADSTIATIDLVLREEPVPPRRLNTRLPIDLETIALRCLEKQPTRRYSSAEELADDLERYQAGRPIHAKPITGAQRAAKFIRRHPAYFALMMVSVTALMILITVWVRFTEQLGEQTQIAQAQTELAEQNLAELTRSHVATNEVLSFVVKDLLDAAVPDNEGVEVTVLEAVQQAEQKIGERFIDQPQTEAAIRATIGNLYFTLSKTDKALEHLSRSLELYEQNPSAVKDESALDAKIVYGICLQSLGRIEEARAALEALQTPPAQLDAGRSATVQNALAGCLIHEQRYQEAETALVALQSRCVETLGKGHTITLQVGARIGYLYHRQGKQDLALKHYERTFQEARLSLGANHARTLEYAHNTAAYLAKAGRHDEAETIYKESLREKYEKYGDQHPSTLGTKESLAMLSWRQGRHQSAITQMERVIDEKRSALGPRDRKTIGALHQISRMYWEQKRYQQAVDYLGPRLEPLRETPPPVPDWISAGVTYARHLTKTQQVDQSKELLVELREHLEAQWPDDHGRRKMLETSESDHRATGENGGSK